MAASPPALFELQRESRLLRFRQIVPETQKLFRLSCNLLCYRYFFCLTQIIQKRICNIASLISSEWTDLLMFPMGNRENITQMFMCQSYYLDTNIRWIFLRFMATSKNSFLKKNFSASPRENPTAVDHFREFLEVPLYIWVHNTRPFFPSPLSACHLTFLSSMEEEAVL